MTKSKKISFLKKFLIMLSALLLLLVAGGAYFIYTSVVQPNVALDDVNSKIVFIPTGSDFNDVLTILHKERILVNGATFSWLAEIKGYTKNVKPGRYRILARMGNNELLNILKAGIQEPVKFNFYNIRTKEQLASRVSSEIEAGKDSLIGLLNNDEFLMSRYGLNSSNILSMFIPDNYKMNWNTSALHFMDKMAEEYKRFWTEERKQKAKSLDLSQSEVSILASIVQAEQSVYEEEKPIIAGLYINRLRKNIPLQSDPTVVYALGDFTISRVLSDDLKIDSPYNTYKNAGLPPGPILLPNTSSIDAILNSNRNDYLYMCAKEDFSGKHYFTKSYAEHQKCAALYRKALNREGIKR